MSALANIALAVALPCTVGCLPPDEDEEFDDAPVLAGMLDASLDAAVASPRDAAVDASRDAATATRSTTCPDLFASPLHTYEVQLSPAELDKLMREFLRPVVDTDGSGYLHPYHPIVLKLGNQQTSAMIRLKGDSSWLETVRRDRNPKAQFVIAFDRVDKSARFHGLSKLEFDMPRTDPTYLRERVGNQVMRELGLGGVCATSARLTLNGKYYGLYVLMEDMNKQALKRIFPEAPGGALWKSGVELEGSATAEERARQQAWERATDIPSMRKVIDLEQAIHVWAGEIALNNADGYYGGDHNFYTYDYPGRGLCWLPTDLDSIFDYIPWSTHPVYWWESHDGDQTAGQHYRAVINDPAWRARLVEAVAKVLSRWDVRRIQTLVDHWAAEVSSSIRDDPHRWVTPSAVTQATAELREAIAKRPEYLRTWLQCERTNTGTDADRDGFPWCKDCNDRRATAHPGAREICRNGRDDNCNGLKDEGCR